MAGSFEWYLPNGQRRQPWELLTHERLLSWDIRPRENVIVIGGYSGDECQFILDRYPDIELWTFEPQLPFYTALATRFAYRPNVHVFPYGLGNRSGTFDMTRAGVDRASFLTGDYAQLAPEEPDSVGELREWCGVMQELGIESLALLHSNIEQYEYILFPHLIRTGWIANIGQAVVQIHGFPNIEMHPDAQPLAQWAGDLERTHPRLWESAGSWIAWTQPDRHVRDVLAEMRAEGLIDA